MQLIKNYPDKSFVLANNVDLDNINWKPFDFSGTLDGKGFTILNLYINRTDSYQGLFSRLSSDAKVKNLTIKGVKIDASSAYYVGALAGYAHWSAMVSKCNIVFTPGSMIKGNECVGGIVGYSDCFANAHSGKNIILECEVTSPTDEYVISGESSVGGTPVNHISMCSFVGKLSADQYVGGIAGSLKRGRTKVIACYADGTIQAESSMVEIIGGLVGDGVYDTEIHHSYSTVTSTSAKFDGIGCKRYDNFDGYLTAYDSCTSQNTTVKGSNIKAKCTDIASFMKESYSEYASLWHYNSTWAWSGKIDGVSKTVKSPKLAWE